MRRIADCSRTSKIPHCCEQPVWLSCVKYGQPRWQFRVRIPDGGTPVVHAASHREVALEGIGWRSSCSMKVGGCCMHKQLRMNRAPRCLARTRGGKPCQSPAGEG